MTLGPHDSIFNAQWGSFFSDLFIICALFCFFVEWLFVWGVLGDN